MDTQQLRLLMDINSLQSLGAVQSFTSQPHNTSTLFSTMLGEMLSSSTMSNSIVQNSSTQNPLAYRGLNDVYFPSTLSKAIAAINEYEAASNQNNMHESNGYSHIIKSAAEKFQLPERLISSVIQHESNFNSSAVSSAGAQGLMQLMPGTARFLGVKNSLDPEQNIHGGARYLRQMLNQFEGSLEHALAAYNAGPGNVRKYGGIPPFKETQNYVKKVLNTFYS